MIAIFGKLEQIGTTYRGFSPYANSITANSKVPVFILPPSKYLQMFTVPCGPFLKNLKLFYFYVAILDIITMADGDF